MSGTSSSDHHATSLLSDGRFRERLNQGLKSRIVLVFLHSISVLGYIIFVESNTSNTKKDCLGAWQCPVSYTPFGSWRSKIKTLADPPHSEYNSENTLLVTITDTSLVLCLICLQILQDSIHSISRSNMKIRIVIQRIKKEFPFSDVFRRH